ncbi:MAG TPA: hypothetical protein VGI20_10060 [Rhizomicrobium sp.]
MSTQLSNGKLSNDPKAIIAAAMLVVAALLSLVAVIHHPVLRDFTSNSGGADTFHAAAATDRLVHGALMALAAVQVIGFYCLSKRLNFANLAVVAAFAAYGAGALITTIPATLDGFVVPSLVETCTKSSSCEGPYAPVFSLVASCIQEFTKLALVCVSLAILGWACTIVRRHGLLNRLTGSIGLLCATAPLATLLATGIQLRPRNLAEFVLAQLVWNVAAASVLLEPCDRLANPAASLPRTGE